MAYPSSKTTFSDPNGTTRVDTGVDHAALHTSINDTVEALQDTVGTTAGTNVLKNFAAGDFPARINASNVMQQRVSGTVDSAVLGTPMISAGTFANAQLIGTPQITGGTITNAALIGTSQFTGGSISGQVVNNGTVAGGVYGTAQHTGGTYTNMYLSGPISGFAYVSAYLSADSGTLPTGTATAIVFDTEEFDFGSNYNNTTGTFTAPSNGLYEVNGQMYFYTEIVDQKQYQIQIYKNGSLIKDNRSLSSGVAPVIPNIQWLGSLAANDTLSWFAISNSTTGSSKIFGNSAESYMNIKQITRT